MGSVATFCCITKLGGQVPSSSPRGGITGVVRDATTLKPLEKVWLCATIPSHGSPCTHPDSLGRYRLDSLPASKASLRLTCDGVRPWTDKEVATDTVVVPVSGHTSRDWNVSTVGCDLRPVRRLRGTFRGYYTAAFEGTDFVPCKSDAWFIKGDSIHVYREEFRGAWVTPARRDWLPLMVPKWPELPRDKNGKQIYYVRFRGAVVGPGHYGHMGAWAFHFLLDSIVEIRAPRARDCKTSGG